RGGSDQGEQERESENARIIVSLGQAWDLLRRELDQQIGAPPGQQQTARATQQPDEQALRQQLPRNAPTPGPQRKPNRHLAFSPRSARQQQIRKVHTCDQQYESDPAQQNP